MEYSENEKAPSTLLPALNKRLGLNAMPSQNNVPFDSIKTAFGDADWHKRVEAALAASEYPDQIPLEMLLSALQDEDVSVRAATVRVLGNRKTDVPVAQLIEALYDNEWLVREAAVLTLGELGELMPREQLMVALNDHNVFVRQAAQNMLDASPPPVAVATQVVPPASFVARMLDTARRRFAFVIYARSDEISQDTQEDVSGQQTGTVDSTPLTPVVPTHFKLQRHIVRFVNGLAAVLVIGAIIGASVLLFTRHSPPTTATPQLPPVGSRDTSGLTVVASSTVDGLTMSLAITPGPHFLSEMLAAKVTLTNYSQKNAYPLPFSGVGSCGYHPGVEIPYTGNPQFNIPIAFDHSCPYTSARPATLKPGHTMSSLGYIPLQQSGQLTLTSPANFYTGPASQQNFPDPTSLPDPFGSQGLVARIHVSPTIPADRRIPFKVQGYNAVVKAPLSAKGPLLYAYSIGCQDVNNDGGSTWSGNFSWDTLTNATVHRPGCPGKNLQSDLRLRHPGLRRRCWQR